MKSTFPSPAVTVEIEGAAGLPATLALDACEAVEVLPTELVLVTIALM